MPIPSLKKDIQWHQIRGNEITATIRSVVHSVGPSIGFTEADISARSLRAAGAMALLIALLYPYTIYLVGRWRSDTMLRYQNMTAKSFIESLDVKNVSARHLHSHSSHTCRKILTSGTHRPSRPPPQVFYGGLLQDQCGLGK